MRSGKAYLDAGATCVFVWGGDICVLDREIGVLIDAFQGKLAVRFNTREGG